MKNTKLQAMRIESGKTQAQVANAVGITEQMYQRYEYGNCLPNVQTAIKIADVLGVTDLRQLFAPVTDKPI